EWDLASRGGAETAFNRLTSVANYLVITRLASDLEGALWYHHDRRIGAAACALAVATMAVQHHDRIGVTLVMDGATGAPARYLLCDGRVSEGSTSRQILPKRSLTRTRSE